MKNRCDYDVGRDLAIDALACTRKAWLSLVDSENVTVVKLAEKFVHGQDVEAVEVIRSVSAVHADHSINCDAAVSGQVAHGSLPFALPTFVVFHFDADDAGDWRNAFSIILRVYDESEVRTEEKTANSPLPSLTTLRKSRTFMDYDPKTAVAILESEFFLVRRARNGQVHLSEIVVCGAKHVVAGFALA